MRCTTGVSSGISEAIARPLAAAGHRVVLLPRLADHVQAPADELYDEADNSSAEITTTRGRSKAPSGRRHGRGDHADG